MGNAVGLTGDDADFARHRHKLYMQKWRQETKSRAKPQHMYVLVAGEHIKVGVAENPERRIRSVASCNPLLDVSRSYVSPVKFLDAAFAERQIHGQLAEHRVIAPHCTEWFKCDASKAIALIEELITRTAK
jgi:hypothetical protein